MGEKVSALTVSSWTSLPVAMPAGRSGPRHSPRTPAHGIARREWPGGNLGTDEQRKRTRLRRVERYAEFARVRVESPQRDQGDGGAFGESAAAGLPEPITSVMVVPAARPESARQFPLSRPDSDVMRAFNHTRGGRVELDISA